MIPDLDLTVVEQLLMFLHLHYLIVTFSLLLRHCWPPVMQTVILTLPSQPSTGPALVQPGTMNKQYFVLENKNSKLGIF